MSNKVAQTFLSVGSNSVRRLMPHNSEFIKRVRTQLGLTQQELAKKLGASFATVNGWENGRTLPSRLAQRQIDLLLDKEGRLNG